MTDLTSGISNLKQFIIENNIVGTSAGVCVALAAKDGIQSLVGDIIIPSMIILLHTLNIGSLTKYLPVNGKAQLNITQFIKQMITFFLIIIISFLFVNVAFGYLLGIDNSKKNTANSTNTTNAIVVEEALEGIDSSNKEQFGIY
jgi:large-conductance mechanosensitive channel